MKKSKVSKEYKKAFSHADMICRYMPQELERLAAFENVAPEYKRGFEDRVKKYRMEQDATQHFSIQELKEKYGKGLNHNGRNKTIGKDLDKDM
ncbi:hypothetical protein [Reichenbachiella sp.]|uniref:hypothetical protein n=1 Tax=Reichenbachiella sp. TaxID=2184521 RepID=UPI003299A974